MTKSLIATAGMLFILTAFIGCDNSAPVAKSAEKSITSFSFTQALNPNLSVSQVDGVIDESGKNHISPGKRERLTQFDCDFQDKCRCQT